MPYKEGQPTLIDFLVRPFLHIKVVKKDAFGKPHVYLFEYFTILKLIFESGAILGRAMCDKIDEFKKMVLTPNSTEDEVLELATKTAEAQLADFKKEYGSEPSGFVDFIHGELFKGAIGLSIVDCGEVLIRDKKRYKEIKRTIDKKAQQKVVLSQEAIYGVLANYSYRGIGFGIMFPALTKKMTTNFVNRAEELLLLAAYTQEFYPELIDDLELRDYIDTEGSRHLQSSTTGYIAQRYEFYQSQLEIFYVDATTDAYTSSISQFWKLYAEELGLKKDIAKADKEAKAVVVEFVKLVAAATCSYRTR